MAMSPQQGSSASPEAVWEMLTAYQQTAALSAAIQLDLFRYIGEGPGDVASLAQQCRASERGIRIICDYLTIRGMLQKDGAVYRHSSTSAVFLDPKSPACIAAAARFMGSPELYAPYARLAEVVRSGHTTLPGEGTVEPDNPVWVEFARSMAPLVGAMAGPFAEAVLSVRNGPVRVLDIAAGHGLFGIEIAKRNAEAEIVALDWASVLEVARENAAKAGVVDRYQALPGSAFEVEFGRPYDIVLVTNFLHHFDRDTCTNLLRKIHAACAPGAVVATLEFVPNEDRVTPPPAAAFSMTMLASTRSGDAYTFRELASMYEAAGFKQIESQAIPQSPQTVVLGIKG